MKNLITLILFFTCPAFFLPAQAQDERINMLYRINIEGDFFKRFFNREDFSLYLSPDGEKLIASAPSSYQIIKTATGATIASGDFPQNNLLDKVLAKEIANVNLDKYTTKGGSFLVLEDRDIVIFTNWHAKKKGHSLHAYDLNDGRLLWETEDVQFNSKDLTSFYAKYATNNRSSITYHSAYGKLDTDTYMFASDFIVESIFQYFPEIEAVLVKNDDHSALMDINTGEVIWRYHDRTLIPGTTHYLPSKNEIVIVNYATSDYNGKNRFFVKINAETGEETAYGEYLGNYSNNQVFFIGNRMVINFIATEIYDLESGERLALSADEGVIKTMNFFGANASSSGIDLHTILDDQYVYTINSKVGKRTHPGAAGKKSQLVKYDIQSGELVMEAPIESAYTFLDFHGDYLIAVAGNPFKSALYAIDVHSGQVVWETEKTANREKDFMSDLAIGADKIIKAGKKELYVYDIESGDLLQEMDLKGLKIGKIQLIENVKGNLFVLGSNGIAFVGSKGELQSREKASKDWQNLFAADIKRSYWNDDLTFIFESRKLNVYDNHLMESVGTIDYLSNYRMDNKDKTGTVEPFPSHVMYLTRGGNYFAQLLDGNRLHVYEINQAVDFNQAVD